MAKMTKYTVVGRYPNGHSVIVQITELTPFHAHKAAVGKIFRDTCLGKIPDTEDGRLTRQETIKQITADLDIVVILEGHTQSAFLAHIEHLRPCISHLITDDEPTLQCGHID